MKRAMLDVLMVGLIALGSGVALAEGLPWEDRPGEKAPAPEKPGEPGAPAAAKPAVDLEKALKPEVYTRTIRPILYQFEEAKKYEDLYAKEMEKPDNRRSERTALGFRVREARAYLNAITRAERAAEMVQEKEHKDAIVEQYEKPARERACKLYTELAEAAMKTRDVRGAWDYYRQVLKIDPENATATEEIKKIEEMVRQAIADKGGSRSTGGGPGENERRLYDEDKDWSKEGRDPDKDYKKTGRDDENFKKPGYSP